MDRHDLRQHGHGFSIQIIQVNGEAQERLINQFIDIENISKGGFRFTTNLDFQLEDRIKVILNFPDDTVKNVFGRICYSKNIDTKDESISKIAYGYSVLDGFYELPT